MYLIASIKAQLQLNDRYFNLGWHLLSFYISSDFSRFITVSSSYLSKQVLTICFGDLEKQVMTFLHKNIAVHINERAC